MAQEKSTEFILDCLVEKGNTKPNGTHVVRSIRNDDTLESIQIGYFSSNMTFFSLLLLSSLPTPPNIRGLDSVSPPVS